MTAIENLEKLLRVRPKKWLVTGAAGFIGSNLVERLLELDQQVVGLDNFSTGYPHNLIDLEKEAGRKWERFKFIEADIQDLSACRKACDGADIILHQAALGSVPRSIDDPIGSTRSNVEGFLHMLVAARDCGAKRFVYASSSAVYGDCPDSPKFEQNIGRALSPYAVTKYVNELYADVFALSYGVESVGLRYFNVFGKRQDPNGAYAAVIPRWMDAFLKGERPIIYGDGQTTRDFCYIENVVDANLLAGAGDDPRAINNVFNIACGDSTSLLELCGIIRGSVAGCKLDAQAIEPVFEDFRKGDIRHSLADISRAREFLGYEPVFSVKQGMEVTAKWYVNRSL